MAFPTTDRYICSGSLPDLQTGQFDWYESRQCKRYILHRSVDDHGFSELSEKERGKIHGSLASQTRPNARRISESCYNMVSRQQELEDKIFYHSFCTEKWEQESCPWHCQD